MTRRPISHALNDVLASIDKLPPLLPKTATFPNLMVIRTAEGFQVVQTGSYVDVPVTNVVLGDGKFKGKKALTSETIFELSADPELAADWRCEQLAEAALVAARDGGYDILTCNRILRLLIARNAGCGGSMNLMYPQDRLVLPPRTAVPA